MVNCPDCRFWRVTDNQQERGVCENEEHIKTLIHDMKIAYYNKPLHQLEMLKYYEPYVTDKYHRCLDGERDRD